MLLIFDHHPTDILIPSESEGLRLGDHRALCVSFCVHVHQLSRWLRRFDFEVTTPWRQRAGIDPGYREPPSQAHCSALCSPAGDASGRRRLLSTPRRSSPADKFTKLCSRVIKVHASLIKLDSRLSSRGSRPGDHQPLCLPSRARDPAISAAHSGASKGPGRFFRSRGPSAR